MYGFMKPQGLKCLRVNLPSINPFKPTSEISNPAEKRQTESRKPRRLDDVLNAFDKGVLGFVYGFIKPQGLKCFRVNLPPINPFKPTSEISNPAEKRQIDSRKPRRLSDVLNAFDNGV